MKKRVKICWMSVLYKTKDQKLIDYFWWFFNHHRLSKNSAARNVLLHYYSTTAAPDFVLKAFSLHHDIEVAKFNYYGV